MPRVHEKLVRITASVVRRTYIQERSLIDGKPYQPTAKWDGNPEAGLVPIWVMIAEKLLLYGVEPEQFVRYYFEHLAVVGGNRTAYYPTDLMNEGTIRKYRTEGMSTAVADLRDALDFQISSASTAILKEQALRKVNQLVATKRVLWDLEIDLSPLFRFCLATSMKRTSFRPIRDHFKSMAAIQYSSNFEAYDKVWKDRIPENFKSYVTKHLGLACKGRYS